MSDCPPWVPYHHGIKMSVFSKADTSNNIRNAFVIRHRHEWSMIKSFLRRSPRNKGNRFFSPLFFALNILAMMGTLIVI